MVQFDNVYKILAEDIVIHYQAVLDELISKYVSIRLTQPYQAIRWSFRLNLL